MFGGEILRSLLCLEVRPLVFTVLKDETSVKSIVFGGKIFTVFGGEILRSLLCLEVRS